MQCNANQADSLRKQLDSKIDEFKAKEADRDAQKARLTVVAENLLRKVCLGSTTNGGWGDHCSLKPSRGCSTFVCQRHGCFPGMTEMKLGIKGMWNGCACSDCQRSFNIFPIISTRTWWRSMRFDIQRLVQS